MRLIQSLHDAVFGALKRFLGPWLLPTLARFAFAATLMRLIQSLHDAVFGALKRFLGPWLLPTLARFAFAATLMRLIQSLHDAVFGALKRFLGPWLLPTLARFAFAATLLIYYWNSALTKLGDDGLPFGVFAPATGAYIQIFPRTMEAISYDVSQLGVYHWAVVVFATISEFVLPALLIVGLFTRVAALGMIGFVAVQTLTDLFGHGAILHPQTLGVWFDGKPDSLILDQRLLWVVLLLVPVLKGAGPLSLDRLLRPPSRTG